MFEFLAAFDQVMMLIGAVFCLTVGGVLFGNDIIWRRRAERVSGTVIGVRQEDNIYLPVYQYMMPTGETFEATSDTGSSSVKGKETYRTVPLLVFPSDPLDVCPADSYAPAIIGLLVIVLGAVLAWVALTHYPVTPMSWIILGAMTFWGAMRFKKHAIPKEQRLTPKNWKASRRARRQEELARLAQLPIRPIEEILASPEATVESALQKKRGRLAAPAVLLYLAEDPQKTALVEGHFRNWVLPIIIFSGGVLLLLLFFRLLA